MPVRGCRLSLPREVRGDGTAGRRAELNPPIAPCYTTEVPEVFSVRDSSGCKSPRPSVLEQYAPATPQVGEWRFR